MDFRFIIFLLAFFSYPFVLILLLLGVNQSRRITSKEFLKLAGLYRKSLDFQQYLPQILWFVFTLLYWYHQLEKPGFLFSGVDYFVTGFALSLMLIGKFVRNLTKVFQQLLTQCGVGLSLAIISLYPLGFLEGKEAYALIGRELAAFSLIAIISLRTVNLLLGRKKILSVVFYFCLLIASVVVRTSIFRYLLATLLFLLPL